MRLRCLPECQGEEAYRPLGSDGPGVPFDGSPVFRPFARSKQVSDCCSSRRLPLLFRARARTLRRAGASRHPGSHRADEACAASLLGFRALQRMRRPDPSDGVAMSHRCPLVAFLRLQQAGPRSARSNIPPGLFRPGNAPELDVFRAFSRPKRRTRFRGRSSRAVWLRALAQGTAAKGCTLREAEVADAEATDHLHALMTFSPLRPSLPPPWHRLPGTSSHALRRGRP